MEDWEMALRKFLKEWETRKVVAIFGITSIFLICGKGSWLVAGYNTMSK